MIDWDHNVVDYDLDKFPWYERILSVIQEVKPECYSIGRLHEYFDRTEIVPLRKKIEQFVRTKEFSGWVDDYFHHIIGDGDYLIQATPTLNVVLPDQQKHGSLLTFHTGHLTAYNNGINTIWTPISSAFGSNSMQVVSRQDSKYLTEAFFDLKLSMADMQYLCHKFSYPVEIKTGQAWLFDQDHWHGNINNTTEITRIGLDIRAMEKGTSYGYRKPGSYFRFPKTTVEVPEIDVDRRWIVFNDPAGDYMGTMPFYIARSFIEN